MRSTQRYVLAITVLAGSLGDSILGQTIVIAQETVPDLSGFWTRRGPRVDPDFAPPLTPQGQRLYEINKAGIAASDPEIDLILQCLPRGFPRLIQDQATFYLAQTDDAIAWIGGAGGVPHMIYMNDDFLNSWPLFFGDAIGRWEGNTLVIEVKNVTTKTFMHDSGLPHSNELHVTERMTLIEDGAAIQNDIVMEDPVILTEPWEYTVVYERSDEKPVEFVCENTRLR